MEMLIVDSAHNEAMVRDSIVDDRVAAGAAAVFGDGERTAVASFMPRTAHQNDRVGIGENVTLGDRLGHQIIEHHMGRRVEVQATDCALIVSVIEHRVLVGPILLAKPLPWRPNRRPCGAVGGKYTRKTRTGSTR